MKNASPMKACALSAVLLGVAGCASPKTEDMKPLPFTVAVIPTEAVVVADVEGDPDNPPLTISLAIEDTRLSDAVVKEFAKKSFVQVVALADPGDDSGQAFHEWSLDRQAEWWTEAARRSGADVLLECQLTYSPDIRTYRNDKFWPNMVLYSIGGPFNMLTADRSYQVKAELRARLFDLNPIYGRRAALFDRESLLVDLRSESADVELDLTDRAENVGDYGLGIIVPSSFLATENDTVRTQVEGQLLESLCLGLIQKLGTRSGDVIVGEQIAAFYLDVEQSRAVRAGSSVQVVAEFVLRGGGDADALDDYRIAAGETERSGAFGSGVIDERLSIGRERSYRFRIDETFEAPADVTLVRISVTDDSRDRKVRSFTLPIVPKESTTSAP